MKDDAIILPATVEDFDLYAEEEDVLTASLELDINGDIWIFGGHTLFMSEAGESSSNYVTHFVNRCLQVCHVKSIQELIGVMIKVKVIEDQVVGIASVFNDNWFYPVVDFERLAKGDDLEINEQD